MPVQPDTLVAPEAGHYLAQFDRLQENLPGIDLEWSREDRMQGLVRFGHIGFPTQRDEDWRYTPLRPVTSKEFDADPLPASPDLDSILVPGLESHRIVFVDGKVAKDLSSLGGTGSGIRLETLEEAFRSQPDIMKQRFGSVLATEGHGFMELNRAMYRDGVVLILDDGVEVEKPVELLFIAGADQSMSQTRNLVIVGAQSRVKVIERYCSSGDICSLTNSATEIILGDQAEVDYYMLQTPSASSYQVSGLWVNQAKQSRFSCRTATLGGALVRNDLRSDMQGEGAHCDMLGVYSLAGRQHVDNHTTMVHSAESCTSNELYKGVLDQRSRAVFHGRIHVKPGAQHTDAEQANNTLLLSRDAEIDTKPQLEIYADDVKCSHGATIGQIDEDSLFYLRSRGIDTAEARSLLTYAFVNEVIEQVDIEPLREYLESMLGEQLIREQEVLPQ